MAPVASGRTRRRLGRSATFTVLTIATVVTMATASAPSPLYPLYRDRWDFSVTMVSVVMVTVIFAVYVAGLLGAPLTVGSPSDRLGRRPVLITALLPAAASTTVFRTADGMLSLVVARVVQGVATGAAMSGLAAGLVESSPPGRPHMGTTVTAVGTNVGAGRRCRGGRAAGAVGPAPRHVRLLRPHRRLPGPRGDGPPGPRDGRAGSRRAGLAAPRGADTARSPAPVRGRRTRPRRGTVRDGVVPRAGPLRRHRHPARDVGRRRRTRHRGVVPSGGVGGLWSLRHTARSATLLGAVFLALGAAGPAVAVAVASPIAFACGSAMAGLGAGLTFNGNLRGIAEVTTADSRSGVFSAVCVVSYAAPSLPSLPAGLLSPSLGAESHELSLHRVRRSPVADRPRPCRLLPVRWARRTCPTPPPRPHRPGAAAHACRTTARDHDTI